MSKKWKPGIVQMGRFADGCVAWLRVPQPPSSCDGDADTRRARTDLDAVRARFPDRA